MATATGSASPRAPRSGSAAPRPCGRASACRWSGRHRPGAGTCPRCASRSPGGGEDHRQGDEGAAVLGPAGQDRDLGQIGVLASEDNLLTRRLGHLFGEHPAQPGQLGNELELLHQGVGFRLHEAQKIGGDVVQGLDPRARRMRRRTRRRSSTPASQSREHSRTAAPDHWPWRPGR